MPVVQCVVTAEEKRRWKAYCARIGTTESAAFRRLAAIACLQENLSDPAVAASEEPARRKKITVRLADETMQKLRSRTEREGHSSPTAWVAGLVMAALYTEPVLTKEEAAELRESNRQLSAIGTNLNQLARAVNASPEEAAKVTAKAITTLSERVENHLAKVAALLNKNRKRRSASNG
jgi:hypothetical protein